MAALALQRLSHKTEAQMESLSPLSHTCFSTPKRGPGQSEAPPPSHFQDVDELEKALYLISRVQEAPGLEHRAKHIFH